MFDTHCFKAHVNHMGVPVLSSCDRILGVLFHLRIFQLRNHCRTIYESTLFQFRDRTLLTHCPNAVYKKMDSGRRRRNVLLSTTVIICVSRIAKSLCKAGKKLRKEEAEAMQMT